VPPAAAQPLSAWAPLHHRVYRALWIAQFTSNVGTWMQTVGAQWLMGSLSNDPLLVALVQTAMTLPFFLAALPAGAAGDIFDRRRLLLASQSFMLLGAALLAALAWADATTPALLLLLVFWVGLGQAITGPSWQALQPDLVDRHEIPQAAALGGMSMNLARALGPALGGALVAAGGPEWVFALNAVSFLAVLGVLAWWRRPAAERALGAEHFGPALRAGPRYVRSSPRLRSVLARAGLFGLFASGTWALLPVLARNDLGLGSGGYGLLLADVGLGAILGAWSLPRLRARLSLDALVATGSCAFAVACLALAWLHSVPAAAAALVLAGMAWISTLGSLNGSAQTALPNWVRSRGMALYLLVFLGSQALGGLIWGLVTQWSDTRTAFSGMAAGLLLAAVFARRRWRLRGGEIDLSPHAWPEPQLAIEPEPHHGPVLVTTEYRVPVADQEAFRDAMTYVARARRRTGAQRWGLFQDGADPELFLETFVVPTWDEHLRQHTERATVNDQRFFDQARSYQTGDGGPHVRHLFFAYD
jgi:MFS family permease